MLRDFNRRLDIKHCCQIFGLNLRKVSTGINKFSNGSQHHQHHRHPYETCVHEICSHNGLTSKEACSVLKHVIQLKDVVRTPSVIVSAMILFLKDKNVISTHVDINHILFTANVSKATFKKCLKEIKLQKFT